MTFWSASDGEARFEVCDVFNYIWKSEVLPYYLFKWKLLQKEMLQFRREQSSGKHRDMSAFPTEGNGLASFWSKWITNSNLTQFQSAIWIAVCLEAMSLGWNASPLASCSFPNSIFPLWDWNARRKKYVHALTRRSGLFSLSSVGVLCLNFEEFKTEMPIPLFSLFFPHVRTLCFCLTYPK